MTRYRHFLVKVIGALYVPDSCTYFSILQETRVKQKCCDKSKDGKKPDVNDEVVKLENANRNENHILGNIQTFGKNIIQSLRRFK